MAKRPNLNAMSAGDLIKLKNEIAAVLDRKARELKRELALLGGKNGGSPDKNRRGPRPGRKVAPKYRGPNGELWSGRGLTPRWLSAELKKGKKLESFAIRK